MKLLELFSGIGGFSLGFERAGYKFDWIGYSEIDKYANEVFERRFPNAVSVPVISAIAEKMKGIVYAKKSTR